jgi:hypothetical protein
MTHSLRSGWARIADPSHPGNAGCARATCRGAPNAGSMPPRPRFHSVRMARRCWSRAGAPAVSCHQKDSCRRPAVTHRPWPRRPDLRASASPEFAKVRSPRSATGSPMTYATAWPSKSLTFRRANDRFKPRCPDVSGTRSRCGYQPSSALADSDLVSLAHGSSETAFFGGFRCGCDRASDSLEPKYSHNNSHLAAVDAESSCRVTSRHCSTSPSSRLA